MPQSNLHHLSAASPTGLPYQPLPAFRPHPLQDDADAADCRGRRVGILIVAHNAVATLVPVLKRITPNVWRNVEEVVVFDDASDDATFELAVGVKALRDLPKLSVQQHAHVGYGATQKAGYRYFLERGFDVVVLLHGSGQYAPEVLARIYEPIVNGRADAVFGSRMLNEDDGGATRGGMPMHRYLANRALTFTQNRALGLHMSECHSGYRAYDLHALARIDFSQMTDALHFDTEMLIKLQHQGLRIAEVPIPTYSALEIGLVEGARYMRDVLRAVRRYRQTIRSVRRAPEFGEYFVHYPVKQVRDSSHDYARRLVGTNQDVLDVACGEGFLARQLQAKGNRVTGVDALPAPALPDAFDTYVSREIREDFQGVIAALGGRTFDRVLLLDILEHLDDPDRVLRESIAVLKPSGRLVVSVPNVANITLRLALLFGRFTYTDRGLLDRTHRRFYTWKTARRLVEDAGWTVELQRPTVMPIELVLGLSPSNPIMRVMNRVLGVATRLLPRLLGYRYCSWRDRGRPQLMRASRASRASADRRAAPAATSFTRGRALLVAIVLTVVASWAYSTSFAGVFLFDDKPAIVDNPNIKALWPLTRALSAPREVAVSARPIASLSLAINYALAPEDARDVMSPGEPGAPAGSEDRFLRNIWGYHALNLTLHVLTALALFGVVRRTLLTPPLAPRFGQASASIAFAVALLWIVHPLLVDAVTYVIQRIEGLMGLFYLLTLYCAIRAWDEAQQARSQKPEARSVRCWQALAVVCAALGMASKQVMVSAPIMVWLWDRTFAPDRPPRRGFYLAVASTWLVLGALVAYERWPHSIGLDREGWTPWTYLLTETGVIVHYVRLALWPSPLVVDYDGWPMASSIVAVLPQAALLAIAAAVTVYFVVRRAPWAFASLWCFMILAPSSSILPLYTEIAAERRAYLVVAGLIALAVTGAYAIGRRLSLHRAGTARLLRPLAWIAVIAIAATYATLTQARNRDFWSEEQIWRDAVEKRPINSRARVNYGSILSATGRVHEAETQLTEAVRLKPTNAAAHMNLGVVLCTLGRVDEGIAHLERALVLNPELVEAMRDLGEAQATQGRLGPALDQFVRALDRRPDDVFLLNRAAWILATAKDDRLRNGAKAREMAEHAVALTARRDVISLDTLAAAQAETGRFELAVQIAGEALALARSQRNDAIVPEIGQRVMLYSQQRPFRQ